LRLPAKSSNGGTWVRLRTETSWDGRDHWAFPYAANQDISRAWPSKILMPRGKLSAACSSSHRSISFSTSSTSLSLHRSKSRAPP
jgi:hypothetical protein